MFPLFVSLISFISVLQLWYRSFTFLGKIIPRYLIFVMQLYMGLVFKFLKSSVLVTFDTHKDSH